jgi:hypothetical protein
MRNEVKEAIHSMRYRVDKQLLLVRISSRKDLY